MGHRLDLANWNEFTENSIAELYDRVWPDSIVDHHEKSRWAFGGNPLGRAPLILARDESSGGLLGVRGGIAWPLSLGRLGEQRVFQLHGTAVDESVRRTGLFSAMTERFLLLANEEGVPLIFNVSVAASRRGYERLGWTYSNSLRRLVLPVRPIRLARHLVKRSSAIRNNHRPDHQVVPDFDELLPLITRRDEQLREHIRTSYFDRRFFEWRFGSDGYRWTGSAHDGFLVYRIRVRGSLRELLVGDIWPGRWSPRRLIFRTMGREKPDLVTSWTTTHHPYYGHLRRSGFLTQPGHALNLGMRTIQDGQTIPSRWALMAADIDTF